MSRIFIIARLEFVKFITRRGFLFTLIGVPVWIAAAAILPTLLNPDANHSVFTVIDTGGVYRTEIARSVERADAAADLAALSNYAKAHADLAALRRHQPKTAAMLDDPSRTSSIAAFQTAGGWHDAFATLSSYLKPGAPAFDLPDQPYVLADPPAELATAPPRNFAAMAHRYLKGDRQVSTGGDIQTLDAIVVVPRDFGAQPAQFWSEHADNDLRDFVQSALTNALRLRAAHRLGDAPASAALDVEADVSRRNPAAGLHASKAAAASIAVAVGAAVVMLIVALMNSMALLQGVVEEKSTRMIEVLLSCATPWEIVAGKIAGVIALALFTVLIWGGTALVLATTFLPHGADSIVAGILHALTDPGLLALIVLYFMCGLLIYGALFLSIGSMSASLADAQAYIGPSMMLIMLPNLFISEVLRAPNGTLATVMSYVPIYTPYIMLLRVGAHPPMIETVTTALLAVGVATFLIWKAGDIFSRHALTTEKPPALGSFFTKLRARFAR